jgi:hypothetical protein
MLPEGYEGLFVGRSGSSGPIRLALALVAIYPLQEFSERGATMAVARLFFGV